MTIRKQKKPAAKPRYRRRPLQPPGPAIDAQLLYTTEEAARFLRLSRRTLDFWRRDGSGPRSVQFGRRAVYRGRDLQAFVEQQFASPKTAA